MPEQKPDWILSSIAGKTGDVENIYKDGLAIGDFSIADDPNKYWASEGIRNMFRASDGNESKESFLNFYNKEKDNFLKVRQAEFDAVNYKAQYATQLDKKLGVERKTPLINKINPDLWGRSFGYDYYDGTGFSKKQQGIREAAIKKGVRVGDNQYVPTNEFKGLAKFAKKPDGSYDIDQDGSTYLIPVLDGEELKSTDQVYNSLTDWMGYYGHDYEWNQIAGSLVKNAVGFFAQTADSLAEFPKAAITAWNGDEGRNLDAYKGIVNFENWVKQWNPSMTEEGMAGGFWSAEALTDLGQQVIWQIAGMVATGGSVGAVAKFLGAGKTAGTIGSTAGRLLMTGLAAGPMSDVAREQGLNGREIASLLALTSAAIYPITVIEEFVAFNKMIGTSYKGIQQAFKDAFEITLNKGLTNKGAIKAMQPNLVMRIKNLMHDASRLPGVVSSAAGEAVEETLEQVVDLGVRNLYNVYNNVMTEDGSDARRKNFQFDWVQEAQALGYSAAGGAIGGAVAGPLMRKFFQHSPDQAYDMYAMIADGKSKTILDYIDYMEKQGRMSYTFKDAKDTYTDDELRSQNREAAGIARGVVEYLTKIYNDQGLDKLYANNKAKATVFRNVLETSSVGKDAAKLFSEIHQTDERISEMRRTDGVPNETDIANLTNYRDEKQDALDRIKRGEFVGDYVAEGLYNLNAIGRQDKYSAWNRSILSGKNFVNLSRTGPTFTEAANEKISEKNRSLLEADKSATIDKFERLTSKGKEKLLNEANQKFNNDYDELIPYIDVLNDQLAEMGNDIGISADDILNPATRDNTLNVLRAYNNSETANTNIKPLISNLLDTNERIKAIDKAKTEDISVPTSEQDLMLNMVKVSETGEMKNTTIPIAQKLLEQLELEKEMNRDGVSLYSSVESTEDIMRSILARIAQVQANPQIVPKANQIYEANDQSKLRVLTSEEQVDMMNVLGNMAAEAERLYQLSVYNANSADQQLRAAALNRFQRHFDLISLLQTDVFPKTEHREIGEIIASHNEALAEALEQGDIEGYFNVRHTMEHAIFEYGKGKREDILSVFKFPPNPAASEINSGKFDAQIKQYEYIRGVLAEDATQIWKAYKAVINNLREVSPEDAKQLLAASDEQLGAIVEAVQGLSAQRYKTFEPIPSIRTAHDNVYYLNSIGGAGKTALLTPLIAGIYQKLNGGKVHLTSLMNKGKGVNKKINLENRVIDFFYQDEGVLGIDLKKADVDILTFVKSAPEDTNLIVFDEVTLLASRQLEGLQEQLNIVNADRQAAGKPLLKILFTGDSNQNSPSQSETSTEVSGIYVKSRHLVAQSEPLTFSFRVENDQLRIFGDWTRNIQRTTGESNPVVTQYEKTKTTGEKVYTEKGVRIHNDINAFNKEVKRLLDRLKTTNDLSKAVYIISDKSQITTISPDVIKSKVAIMTSEEAQGEEWKYVMYHPADGKIFGKGVNLVPKKRFHTAVTRSQQYFVALLDEPNIKSKEGAVYTVRPVSPSRTTKDAQLERASKILGRDDDVLEQKDEFTYDDFKDTYEGDFAGDGTPAPPSTPPPAPPAGGGTEAGGTPSTPQGWVSEFLKTRNRRDQITMSTFYTVEGQEETKKRALYDRHLNKNVDTSKYKYLLTIAKVGSPQYENYVNHNPDYDGSYAIFVEGIVDGKRAVLGVLPEEDLQDYISENDILQGQESISISLDNSFITNSMGFKPVMTWDKTQRRTLGALKEQYGDSITFGSPRVALQDVRQSIEAKGGGNPTAEQGDIILPLSVAYSSTQELNDALLSTPQDNFITFSGVDRSYVPLDNILEELQSFRKEDGRFDMRSGGKYYETLWSHDTKDRISGGERKVGRIVEAINQIYNKIGPEDNIYKSFVRKYTRTVDPNLHVDDAGNTTEETEAKIAGVEAKHGAGRIGAGVKASYLLAEYIDALNEGNKVTTDLYERLLADIQEVGKFKENGGFRFNPRTGPHTMENAVHMQVFEGMDELYDKYLTTTIVNIAHPTIQVSKGDLLNAIQNGKVNPIIPDSQSVSVDRAVDSDNADALRGDPNIVIDENLTLESPESASLYDFQKTFFDGPLMNIFPRAISRFKREFYSKFFNLNNATLVPTDEAITNLKDRFGENAYIPPEDLSKLDLVNSDIDRDKYIDHVLNQNFNFLLNKYAPTIQQVDGVYRFVSSHHKNRSFGEKESFSLLKEGLTEMVATQLENTPIIAPVLDERGNRKPGEYVTTDGYIDVKRDTEEIIDAFKAVSTNTNQSITEALANSDSEILQSLYVRFYAPSQVNVDGVNVHSLSAFIDPNVVPMVDALSVFFLSGEIFNLGAVNINESRSGIPHNPYWRKPNEIRQHGQNAMNRVASEVKDGTSTLSVGTTRGTTTYTLNGESFIKGKNEEYTTEKVLAGLHAIGMDFITEEHLNEMMTYSASQMQLPSAPPEGGRDNRIPIRNKFLMNNVVFPAMSNIKNGTIKFIRDSVIVYSSVARMDGINTSLDTINVGGNRVYRLRNTSPIFHFNRKLNERRGDPRFSQHMFGPDGRYQLTDFYLKDGFKWVTDNGYVRNTQNNDLSWEETLEYDLLWGFADTLHQTKDSSPTFALPVVVFSDGRSDVTPIIKMAGKDPFDTKAIAAELFNSRVAYYSNVEKNLIGKWNEIFKARTNRKTDYKSLAEIQKALSGKGKMKVSEVQRIKGMMLNLDYVSDSNGNAKLNSELLKDIRLYKTGKLSSFEALLEAHAATLRTEIDRLDTKFNLKKRLAERLKDDPDRIVNAFYYNWVATSSEITTLLLGSKHQYKGTNEAAQYVDLTKRAKSLVSNHSMQVTRNENWEAERQRRVENNIPFDDKFLNEGMKLSRFYKVAYTTDPKVDLESFAGETKSQEVYDGATFVTPLTRIFQRASNGGKHGTNVGHVMKNITSAINDSGTTFIKHAEFEFTPEIMRNGTARVANAVQGMMSPKFDEPVEITNVRDEEVVVDKVTSAWDYLTNQLGVKEDLSNVDETHFQQLALFLVENGLQDVPVKELIPVTSAKTGVGAINNMELDSQLRNPVTETLDIFNKGTQLDASKDAGQGLLTRATSQLFNAIGLNWRNPDETTAVLNGLADLAAEVENGFVTLTDEQLEEKLKNLMRVAQDTDNQALTYQQKIIETDYSIDDRQMLNRVISLLNADIVARGMAPRFQGGQYVVHPANELIRIYENQDGTISLKSKRADKTNEGRQLALHSPSMQVSSVDALKALEAERIKEHERNAKVESELSTEEFEAHVLKHLNIDVDFDERIQRIKERTIEGKAQILLTETPQYRQMVNAFKRLSNAIKRKDTAAIATESEALIKARNKIDTMLQSDQWEGGYAEVILPMEMRADFGLHEGMDLNDVSVDFFKGQILIDRKNNNMKALSNKVLDARAEKMYQGFQKRLEGLMIRIPTTGKHSALPTRVVAFMDGSDNSVFVPAELLMLQGADQDYDKGSYLTYEAVAGFIPTVSKDENGNVALDPFFNQVIPKWKTVYIDPNYITKAFKGRTSDIDPTLYKELLRHRVPPKQGVAVRMNQHEEAIRAGIKNGIVDNMRNILVDPKNAVESSISVDNILNTLRSIRDRIQENSQFFQDSYVSYAKMREINQSGVSLTGIFANAGKAYQVAYTALKMQGQDSNDVLYGLGNTDGTTMSNTWVRFAALVQAAVDGAKEQIHGTLGIGAHNSNMVIYMVASGKSFVEISNMIANNQDFMQSLKDNTRYDVENSFYDPTKDWGKKKPELVKIYKRGQEFSTLAQAILNRDLPNTPAEMYVYKRRIEGFVNRAYKDGNIKANFDLLKFINDDTYAQQHVNSYQKLLKGPSKDNHYINILNILKNAPHIRAYMKLYATSVDVLKRKSNISRLAFNLSDASPRSIDSNGYKSIVDFVYGVAVERFMQGKTSSDGRFDLGTIDGRNDFVSYMGNTKINGFIKSLKNNKDYMNNPFVQNGLFVESIPRNRYSNAPQLRTFDINNMEEQKLLALQAGFDALSEADRADLVNYNLITRKGAMGRGSFAQLFNYADTAEFNSFLKGFTYNNVPLLTGRYEWYRRNTGKTTNYHNSIPYSVTEESSINEETVVKQTSNPKRIAENYVSTINGILTKLNNIAKSRNPKAQLFRIVRKNAVADSKYKFFEGLPAMTVSELVLYTLGTSKYLKPKWRSYLENTYKGMTGFKVTNTDIAETVKRCK